MKQISINQTGKNHFFFLIFLFLFVFPGCKTDEEQIELTFTSWRIDDVDEMNRVNDLFTKTHPGITIRFDSYDPTVYDATISNSLSKGAGADIIFLWPFDKGRALYDAGYLYDLTKVIPNLSSYSQLPLKAWTTDNGVTYGVPSVAVTHGIYYNRSVFSKYNIQEPATWDEFIAACEKLLNAGETVIAQGAADNAWTFNRVVFCGLGANFYGGETARLALINRTAKLTDANFIDAFNAVYSLKKYFSKGFESLGYEDAKKMFASGKAAMFIGGSWEISVFEGLGAGSSAIGWFAPPVKKAGDKLQYCYQVDAGIGLNKNSRHLDAAIEYIKWVSGSGYGQSIQNELPGFFSYYPGTLTVSNNLAQEMYSTAATANLTIRLMDEKLNAKTPTGDALMGEALQGMMLGTYTPASAAAYVQNQLNTWFK